MSEARTRGKQILVAHSASNYTASTAAAEAHFSGIDTALGLRAQGPASATDNTLPRFDGTTGKLLQGSSWTLSDGHVLTAAGALAMDSKAISGVKTVGLAPSDNGSKSASFTLDFTAGQRQKATCTGSGALTITLATSSVAASVYRCLLINAGLRTLTWATSSGTI